MAKRPSPSSRNREEKAQCSLDDPPSACLPCRHCRTLPYPSSLRSVSPTGIRTTSQGKALLPLRDASPHVKLVDLTTAQDHDLRLPAPELSTESRPFLDATLSNDDRIAIIASRLKPGLGALVLSVNTNGVLLTRARYPLPQRHEDANAGDPDGFLFPVRNRASATAIV